MFQHECGVVSKTERLLLGLLSVVSINNSHFQFSTALNRVLHSKAVQHWIWMTCFVHVLVLNILLFPLDLFVRD